MKKTATIALLAAAILCFPTMSSAAPRAKAMFDKQKKEVTALKKKAAGRAVKVARTAAESNTTYKPLEETCSIYEGDVWIPAMKSYYTYDEQGRVANIVTSEIDPETEEILADELTRTSYQYDEYGQTTQVLEEYSEDGGETWIPSSKYENAYDPIVTDFRISTLRYGWDDEWMLQMGTKYDVTRNSGKVVTGVDRLTNYMDEFTPIARLTNTVGTDGKVTACKEEELEIDYANNYYWEEFFDFRDIVWENTDGQVIGFEPENYLVGANRMKSAVLYYEDEPEADVAGEFTDETSAEINIDFYNGDIYKFSHGVTDEYGSYFDERFVQYEDSEEIYTESERDEVTFNERGLVTTEATIYNDSGDEYIAKLLYDYTIDPDYDAVRETVVSSYYMEDDEVVPEMKITVDSYTGLSGIASATVGADLACRLQGRSLEITSAGTTAVSVFTTDGRLAASAVGSGAFSVSLNGLSSGFYIVKVAGAASCKTLKIALK